MKCMFERERRNTNFFINAKKFNIHAAKFMIIIYAQTHTLTFRYSNVFDFAMYHVVAPYKYGIIFISPNNLIQLTLN